MDIAERFSRSKVEGQGYIGGGMYFDCMAWRLICFIIATDTVEVRPNDFQLISVNNVDTQPVNIWPFTKIMTPVNISQLYNVHLSY